MQQQSMFLFDCLILTGSLEIRPHERETINRVFHHFSFAWGDKFTADHGTP